MGRFAKELGTAARRLIRTPIFVAAVVASLALGAGATTAIFTVLDAVVLEDLPYPEADALVDLYSHVPGLGFDRWELSQAGYFHFRDRSRTLSALGAYVATEFTVGGDDRPEQVPAAAVTSSLLELLGATAARGRVFEEADDRPGTPRSVLLSHELWVRRFGADPDAVGRTIEVEGLNINVVGVLEPGFRLPDQAVDFWITLPLDPTAPPTNSHFLSVIGRLAPTFDITAAAAEISALTEDFPMLFETAYSPGWMSEARFETRLQPLKSKVVGRTARRSLWLIMGAVCLVLLIAAANVANLLLVRLESRRPEIALRTALGADRRDVFRTFFAEGVIIAVVVVAFASLLVRTGLAALNAAPPAGLPRLSAIETDASSWLLLAVIGCLTALAIGFGPLVRMRSGDSPAELVGRAGTSISRSWGGSTLRRSLVVGQVALSLTLMIGAGLMLRSFDQLLRADPGFEPDGVSAIDFSLIAQRSSTPDQVAAFYRPLLERTRAIPGVVSAGAVTGLPMEDGMGCFAFFWESEPSAGADQAPCIHIQLATEGYFETMGFTLEQGRWFDVGETARETGPLVVTETLARSLWPSRSPVGEGASVHGYREPWFRVVGVTGEIFATGMSDQATPVAFFPLLGPDGARPITPLRGRMTVVVKTDGLPLDALLSRLRSIVAEVDPTAAMVNPRPLREVLAADRSQTTVAMVLLGLTALAAVLLGGIGLYGVVSYTVTRRTREIGIRLALGAAAEQVRRSVLMDSARMVGAGLILGLAGSLLLTRLMESMLYGVEPNDPLTLAAAIALLTVVGLVATIVPSWRVTRVDPVRALRAE